jgi:Protein of unknown function (DUF2815)
MSIIHLSNVRASYLYCFEPFKGKPTPQQPNPKDVYKGDFLMAPSHPDLAKVAALVEKVGSEHQWKGGLNWTTVKESIKAQNMMCLKRGEVSQPGDPNYAGMFFVKANNANRFTVIDGDRTPLTAKDNRPYSGCYVNAIVDIWAQDNQWGRRINATLTGIQFLRHGDAFASGAKAADPDEFGVVSAEGADEPTPTGATDPLAGIV